ncbi:accessory gland-specific peptide 26Ab [Drosophila biarmipes]|uniref:accessory gland-specific peptide 26Ab n=1 Tax=Drosophila biarmipes TaxID=125945 RepID=UPI0007E63A9A|nr:accessory gland-specific peptide 26Ab [Drosophila biarmipes]
MNYIVLLCIFTYICLWQSTDAAPYLSIQSSARSRAEKMVGGVMRTVYDVNVKDDVNDLTGQLVHRRQAEFKSDLMDPEDIDKMQRQLSFF